MPTGLQIFRADGSIQVDMTMRITKFIGIVNAAGAKTGSESISLLPNDQVWYFPLLGNIATTLTVPTITATNSSISWSWPAAYPGYPILYGAL